jgi:hypothetical protein
MNGNCGRLSFKEGRPPTIASLVCSPLAKPLCGEYARPISRDASDDNLLGRLEKSYELASFAVSLIRSRTDIGMEA